MTLVYIPGLLSDARVWRPVAQRVGGDWCHADIGGGATITAMAENVLADAPGRIVPVGHSMGARVAMEMARLAPGRVAGVVLADTGHHPLAPGEREKRLAKIALGHRDMGALADEWLPPMVDPSRHGDRAFMDDLRGMVLATGAERHERQIRALIARPEMESVLRALTCPVLLLVGGNDGWSPPAQHRAIAAMIGAAQLVEIDGAGHFLPCEKPRETADAIAAWLAATGVAGSRPV